MGMKLCAGALIILLGLSSFAANVVAPTKSELEALYAVAAHALNAGNVTEALKQLDAIDARQPEMAAAKNLRGVALMRIGEYGMAEKALQRARELDPGLWEARFNLAEISFLRKSWAEARHRFEALAEAKSEVTQGATGDLIQFKILLTYLLEGKEKKAAEIVDRLQTSSTTNPAYYCGKAAIALRHKEETEARVALEAAEKSFSPQLNKLFVESFYEVGWMEKPDGAVPVALEVASRADMAVRAQEVFGKAEQAYRQRDYEAALHLLDQVDATAPNQAVSHNLRGKILLAEGEVGAAETALRDAVVADPQFLEARFNLARVPFKQRDYEAARKQLEAILGATSGGKQQRRWEQLIRYQIFLTILLEGRDGPAQKALDEFKMMDDTPALYYAQAAWSFQHGNTTQGNAWVANASNLFPEDLNQAFAAPFVDLGWSSKAGAPATAKQTPPAAGPTPAVQETAAALAPSEEPKLTPTPEASATPAKIAREKKSSPRENSSDRVKKNLGSTAKNRGDSARSNRQRSRVGAATSEASPVPAVPPRASNPVPANASERPHQNLGAKVARFLLYPFQRRNDKPPNPAPAPSKASESPPPEPTRSNN